MYHDSIGNGDWSLVLYKHTRDAERQERGWRGLNGIGGFTVLRNRNVLLTYPGDTPPAVRSKLRRGLAALERRT